MQTGTGDRRRGDRVQHGDRRREDKDRVALTLAARLGLTLQRLTFEDKEMKRVDRHRPCRKTNKREQLRDLSFGDATRQLDEEAA